LIKSKFSKKFELVDYDDIVIRNYEGDEIKDNEDLISNYLDEYTTTKYFIVDVPTATQGNLDINHLLKNKLVY
jgi:hypothetical protein